MSRVNALVLVRLSLQGTRHERNHCRYKNACRIRSPCRRNGRCFQRSFVCLRSQSDGRRRHKARIACLALREFRLPLVLSVLLLGSPRVKINTVRSKDVFSLLECLGIFAIAVGEIIVVQAVKANNCLHGGYQSSFQVAHVLNGCRWIFGGWQLLRVGVLGEGEG